MKCIHHGVTSIKNRKKSFITKYKTILLCSQNGLFFICCYLLIDSFNIFVNGLMRIKMSFFFFKMRK